MSRRARKGPKGSGRSEKCHKLSGKRVKRVNLIKGGPRVKGVIEDHLGSFWSGSVVVYW